MKNEICEDDLLYYKEIVDHSNSIILRSDTECNVTFFNKFAQQFFGYSEEEMLGKNLVGTIVAETDSEGNNLKEMVKNIVRFPERYINNQNENITKDARRVWINWTNRPIYDEAGDVKEIVSIGNDLTYTRQIMLRLEESEKKFKELANNLEQCIWIKRGDNKDVGKYDFISPAFEKIFGMVPNNNYVNLKEFEMLVYPEDRARAMDAIKNRKDNGYDIEYRITRPDGNMAWIWSRAIPVRDAQGKTIKLVGIIQDITFRKLAELEYLRVIDREK